MTDGDLGPKRNADRRGDGTAVRRFRGGVIKQVGEADAAPLPGERLAGVTLIPTGDINGLASVSDLPEPSQEIHCVDSGVTLALVRHRAITPGSSTAVDAFVPGSRSADRLISRPSAR